MATTAAELVARIEADASQLRRELSKVSGDFQKFEENAKGSTRRVSDSLGSLKNAVAGLGLAFAARSIVNASITMEAISSRMLAAAGSADIAAASMSFVREESERLGLVFTDAASSFAGFEAAALRSGLTFKEVKETFLGVAEAATAFKLSSADTSLVFQALQQMAAKGVVSMEEFRQQLGERLPIATSVAAKAMGVTEAQLIDLISTGELASKDFLPKFGAALRREIGDSVAESSKSAQANLNRLTNSFNELKVTVANGGFMNAFTSSVNSLTETLKDPNLQQGLAEVANAIGAIANVAIKAAGAVGSIMGAFKSLGEAIGEGVVALDNMLGGKNGPQILLPEKFDTPEARARVENYLKDRNKVIAEEQAKLAADQASSQDSFTLGGSGGGGGPGFEDLAGKQEKLDAELQQLQDFFKTREDIELDAHQRRIDQLQMVLDSEVQMTASQRQQLEQLQLLHKGAMEKINRDSAKKQFQEDKQNFSNLIASASSSSKILFEINKARAIAEAVLSAREAIAGAYAVGAKIGGPALGAAFAGVAAAATAANIAAIASTSFGSSGSGGGGGGGSNPTNVRTVDELGQPTNLSTDRGREINITVNGSMFDANTVRDLIEQINDQSRDNVRVNVNGRSR